MSSGQLLSASRKTVGVAADSKRPAAGQTSRADLAVILQQEFDKLRGDFRKDLKRIVIDAVREVLVEESLEGGVLKQYKRTESYNFGSALSSAPALSSTQSGVYGQSLSKISHDSVAFRSIEEVNSERDVSAQPSAPPTLANLDNGNQAPEVEDDAGLDELTSQGLPRNLTSLSRRSYHEGMSQLAANAGTPSRSSGTGLTHGSTSAAAGTSKEVRLFGDIDKFLRDMEEASQYDVSIYYKTKGISQKIARNDVFGNLTLAVISCNAIYLGIDSDRNPAASLGEADISFQVSEHLFCIFFTFELLVRFFAFERKRNCIKDRWFNFDSLLVVVMVLETWILPVVMDIAGIAVSSLPTGPLRLLRLARLARMARILRALPELVTMIKGIVVATRAVGSAMLLLLGAIYAFAILMFTLLKDNDELGGYWDTLTISMFTLLCNGVFGDEIGGVVRFMIDTEEYPAIIFFFIFVTIAGITVMNMLIGVLCEVVGAVAVHEKEQCARSAIKGSLSEMLEKVDEDGSGLLEKDKVLQVINDVEALDTLQGLDVDIGYFAGMLDMLFEEVPQLSIPQLIQLIMEFRGQCEANLQDVINCHDYTRWIVKKEFRKLSVSVSHIEDCMRNVMDLNMQQFERQILPTQLDASTTISSMHREALGNTKAASRQQHFEL